MVLGSFPYVLMVLSNLKPSFFWSIPIYALEGFSASLMWTAQGVYLGRIALTAALERGMDPESATSYFNGIVRPRSTVTAPHSSITVAAQFSAAFQLTGSASMITGSLVLQLAGKHADTVLYVGLAAICMLGVLTFSGLRCARPPPPRVHPGGATFVTVLSLPTLQASG